MKKPFLQLGKIDFILLIILFSISIVIKIAIFPTGICVDEGGYWRETKTISISDYYLGKSESIPFHGPLFFYINYLTTHISNSLFSLKFPFILFSFATILLFYLFAKMFFNLKTAFAATLILTTSPAFNLISIFMSPHIANCFFSLAALTAFMLSIKTEEGKYLIFAFLFATLAFLISILGIIVIAALLLSLILVKNSFISIKKDKNAKKRIKISKYVWFSFAAMLILILICAPATILTDETTSRYVSSQNTIQMEKVAWNRPFLSSVLVNNLLFEGQEGVVLRIFAIIGAIAAFIISFNKKILRPVLIYMLLYLFIMSFTQGSPPYLAAVLMFLYLFFSDAVLTVAEKINHRFATAVFIMLIILISSIFAVQFEKKYYYWYTYNFFSYQRYKDAYDFLRSKNESDMHVLASSSNIIRYYIYRDKMNIKLVGLPTMPDKKNFSEFSPYRDYDYVIYWNNPSISQLNKNFSLYKVMEKVNATCKSEINITDFKFNRNSPVMLIFNCKNATLFDN